MALRFASLCFAAWLVCAAGPEGGTTAAFQAPARIGDASRQVEIRFICSENDGPNVTGVLSVEMDVPQREALLPRFDFDPFEGPGSTAGALSTLDAVSGNQRGGATFKAAGFVPPHDDSSAFVLDVTASRRDPAAMRKLGAVLRPLLAGPGRFVWSQGNIKRGGDRLIAALDTGANDRDRLAAVLAPCLKGR